MNEREKKPNIRYLKIQNMTQERMKKDQKMKDGDKRWLRERKYKSEKGKAKGREY